MDDRAEPAAAVEIEPVAEPVAAVAAVTIETEPAAAVEKESFRESQLQSQLPQWRPLAPRRCPAARIADRA